MIAQIIRAADNDLYETGVLLNELEDRSFDDEDEDDEFAESWRPAEYADMSGNWEKKKPFWILPRKFLTLRRW